MTSIPHSDALQADEDLSAKSATAPRVSVEALKDTIADLTFVNLGKAIEGCQRSAESGQTTATAPTFLMTLAVVTCVNGFVVVGKSAPASAANFDKAKGEQFAYEDAMRQLWPMKGYALRERLYQQELIDAGANG